MEVSDYKFGDVVTLRRATFRYQGSDRPYQRWSGRTEKFRYWQIRDHEYQFKEGDTPAPPEETPEQRHQKMLHARPGIHWEEAYVAEHFWPGRPVRPGQPATGKNATEWRITPHTSGQKQFWSRYRSIGIPPTQGIVFDHVTRVEGEIVKVGVAHGEGYRLRSQRRLQLLEILVQPGWVLHPLDKPKMRGGFPRILLACPEDIETQEKLF